MVDELSKADRLGLNSYLNLDRPQPGKARWPLLQAVADRGYSPPHVFVPAVATGGGDGAGRPGPLYDLLAEHCARDLPRRWLLLSGRGTSSSWHIDPLNTSAWNTLLRGRKRWALLPPAAGWPVGSGGESAAEPHSKPPKPVYFNQSNLYTREMGWWGLTAPWRLGELQMPEYFAAIDAGAGAPAGWPKPLQCEQRAGETMFVPSGYWHGVHNIAEAGPTVAITENFAAPGNVRRPRAPLLLAACCLGCGGYCRCRCCPPALPPARCCPLACRSLLRTRRCGLISAPLRRRVAFALIAVVPGGRSGGGACTAAEATSGTQRQRALPASGLSAAAQGRAAVGGGGVASQPPPPHSACVWHAHIVASNDANLLLPARCCRRGLL